LFVAFNQLDFIIEPPCPNSTNSFQDFYARNDTWVLFSNKKVKPNRHDSKVRSDDREEHGYSFKKEAGREDEE